MAASMSTWYAYWHDKAHVNSAYHNDNQQQHLCCMEDRLLDDTKCRKCRGHSPYSFSCRSTHRNYEVRLMGRTMAR